MYTATIALYLAFLFMITFIVTTHPSCVHNDVFDYYSTNNQTNCYKMINSPDKLYVCFNL